MNDSGLNTIFQELPETQTESIQNTNLISEMFTIVREALVDFSEGSFCVATLQIGSPHIEISTRLPVSNLHLQKIKDQMIHHLAENQIETLPPPNLQVIINGQSKDDYNLDETKPRFNQHIIISLSIQSKPAGVLYVGSFDKFIDLRQTKLIQHLSIDVPKALRHLWYLNSCLFSLI